jgi:hypothetical protein
MECLYRYACMNQCEIGDMMGVDYSSVNVARKRLHEALPKDRVLQKIFKGLAYLLSGQIVLPRHPNRWLKGDLRVPSSIPIFIEIFLCDFIGGWKRWWKFCASPSRRRTDQSLIFQLLDTLNKGKFSWRQSNYFPHWLSSISNNDFLTFLHFFQQLA